MKACCFSIHARSKCELIAALSLVLFGLAARAEGPPESGDKVTFKLTTGLYQLSGGDMRAGSGLDLNLRATAGFGNAWVGWYRSPTQDVSQARAGWDSTLHWGVVRFMPSLQIASGGFLGGSAAVETGDSWFAGAGLGRTNLRNYVNLNFDPNDALMLSGGYRWTDKDQIALQVVKDNRLNPDQRHVHLVRRTEIGNDRLTLDLLLKQGLVDGNPIRRAGLSVAYDWPQYFVRVAWDPLVNFTPQNMLRLSVGIRF